MVEAGSAIKYLPLGTRSYVTHAWADEDVSTIVIGDGWDQYI